jgi:hypothetical protein
MWMSLAPLLDGVDEDQVHELDDRRVLGDQVDEETAGRRAPGPDGEGFAAQPRRGRVHDQRGAVEQRRIVERPDVHETAAVPAQVLGERVGPRAGAVGQHERRTAPPDQGRGDGAGAAAGAEDHHAGPLEPPPGAEGGYESLTVGVVAD